MILQELNVRMGLLIDEFQKNAQQAKKEADGMENRFKALKAGLASLGVFAFMKSAIGEFADHQRSVDKLRLRVEALGKSWEEIGPQVNAAAASIQAQTEFGDTQAVETLTQLIGYTNDYNAAMAMLPDVLDLATAKEWDLRRSSEQLGRAFAGDRGALGMLGIEFGLTREEADSYEKVIKAVRQQTEGAAAGQQNLGKSLKIASNAWGDFKKNIGENFDILSGILEKIVGYLEKMASKAKIVRNALVGAFGNMGILFKKGLKEYQQANRELLNETLDDLKKNDEQMADNVMKKTRVSVGKAAKWQKDMKKKEVDEFRKKEMEKIKIAEMALRNQVAAGRATSKELIDLYKENTEKIKELYGEQSVEYQTRMAEQLQMTQDTMDAQSEMFSGFIGGIGAGFEALFGVLQEEGATAGQAMEAMARAMAKSFLGSIAAAIEGEIAKGTAGYLANMLGAGPWGAAPVSAYSLPMLGVLAGLAGTVRGLSAAMAEGGVAMGPTQALIGERRDKVPEIVSPLNRLDYVFEKYAAVMGRGQRSMGGSQTVVKVDARGAYFSDSGFAEGRFAKKVGDALNKRRIIKQTG